MGLERQMYEPAHTMLVFTSVSTVPSHCQALKSLSINKPCTQYASNVIWDRIKHGSLFVNVEYMQQALLKSTEHTTATSDLVFKNK